MADGDTLRSAIPPIFRTVAAQVREGVLDNSELIYNVSESIKKSAQRYKDQPIHFLKEVASYYQDLNGSIFSSNLDLTEEFERIRDMASHWDCNNDALNLAIEAAQKVLIDLEDNIYFEDIESSLYQDYLNGISESHFQEPLCKPLSEEEYNLNQEEIKDKLDDISEGINANIKKFASQLKQNGSVSKLRMPPTRKSKKEFDLDADLNGSLS